MLTANTGFVFGTVPMVTGYLYLGHKIVMPVINGIVEGVIDGVKDAKRELKEMEEKKLSEEHAKG